jgi:heme/copper-type cytochrome/quinol oxidase subunit 3
VSAAVIDVSGLPRHAFGSKSPVWWGTLLFMAMEGMAFVLLVASYLYVHGNAIEWPPSPPLRLGPAALAAGFYAASVVPAALALRAARQESLAGTRLWFAVTTAFAIAATALRWFEVKALPISWNVNAYASLVWTTTGLHIAESIASAGDGLFLLIVLFTRKVDKKHFVDIEVTTLFWFFVVGIWLPIFGLFYWEGVVR